MRNQFRKTNNVNCANSFFLKETVLADNICEQSEHILSATQYEQLREMNGKAPIKSSAVIKYAERKR